MPAMSEPRVIERNGATLAPAGWRTDPISRFLQQLHEAECLLTEALVQTRTSVLHCEQALARLATIREHTALRDIHAATAVLTTAGLALVRDQSDDGRARCRPEGASLVRPLTAREREVLQHISAGKSNREISAALFLSPRTVERHIANIYLKLDVHSRTEAIAAAQHHHGA